MTSRGVCVCYRLPGALTTEKALLACLDAAAIFLGGGDLLDDIDAEAVQLNLVDASQVRSKSQTDRWSLPFVHPQ